MPTLAEVADFNRAEVNRYGLRTSSNFLDLLQSGTVGPIDIIGDRVGIVGSILNYFLLFGLETNLPKPVYATNAIPSNPTKNRLKKSSPPNPSATMQATATNGDATPPNTDKPNRDNRTSLWQTGHSRHLFASDIRS